MRQCRVRLPVCFFDLDNTLIDRDLAFMNWARWFVAEQLHVSGESIVAKEVDWLIALDDGGYGPKPAMLSAIQERYPEHITDPAALAEAFTANLRDHIPPLDDRTIALLAEFAELGIPWGIVTNGSPTQLKKIERVGLAGAKRVIVSGILGIRKPELGIFLVAAEGLGVAREQILFVGDNAEADILGAANAGMTTAWMRRGREWPISEIGVNPDYMIEQVADIRSALGL